MKGGAQEMDLKCSLKEGISEKSGKTYVYVSIMLTPTYEKRVFLDNAELELLKLVNQKER